MKKMYLFLAVLVVALYVSPVVNAASTIPYVAHQVTGTSTTLQISNYHITVFRGHLSFQSFSRFELGSLDSRDGFIENGTNWEDLFHMNLTYMDRMNLTESPLFLSTTPAPAQIVTIMTDVGSLDIFIPDTSELKHGATFYIADDGSTYWRDENHDGDYVDEPVIEIHQAFKPEHLAADTTLVPDLSPGTPDTEPECSSETQAAFQITTTAFTFDPSGQDIPLLKSDGTPILPSEVSELYGSEDGFTIHVAGVDPTNQDYSTDENLEAPKKIVYQDLSDTQGWPNIHVTPDTIAVDPALGRFKFADGDNDPVQELGRVPLIWGSPVDSVKRGNFVYIMTHEGATGLVIVDVTDPANPVIASKLEAGWTYLIKLIGPYAYVTGKGGTLRIFDVSDPYNAFLANTLTFSANKHLGGMVQQGNYLYINQTNQGVHVLDVSDPLNPVVVKETDFLSPDLKTVYIAVSGDYLLVGHSSGINIYNKSDLDNINIVANIDLTDIRVGEFELVGNTLYFPAGHEGLHVYDLTDVLDGDDTDGNIIVQTMQYMAHPSTSQQPRPLMDWSTFLTVQGDRLYVTGNYGHTGDLNHKGGNNGYIQEYDLIDPFHPAFIREYIMKNTFSELFEVQVEGGLAYVIDNELGLRIADLSAGTSTGELITIGQTICAGEADDVYIHGDYAYVSQNMGGRFYIIDISDKSNPHVIGYYNTGYYLYDIVGYKNEFIYVAGTTYQTINYGSYLYGGYFGPNTLRSPLQVIDVSDPTNPHMVYEVDYYPPWNAGAAMYHQYASIEGDLLFGLHNIFDLSNPGEPHMLSYRSWIGGEQSARRNNYLFSATGRRAIGQSYLNEARQENNDQIYAFVVNDIHNLHSQALVGLVEIPITRGQFFSNIVLRGNMAFFGLDGYGYGVVDISDPRNPAYLGRFGDTANRVFGSTLMMVDVHGKYLYAQDYSGNSHIYDISIDPLQPTLVETYPTNAYAWKQVVQGDYAYMVQLTGMSILDIPRASEAPAGPVTVCDNIAQAEPPVANAGSDQSVECSGVGTQVLLDGSASTDPDNDIQTYDWYEDYGLGTETLLGSGEILNVALDLGTHNITLVVTDSQPVSATDSVLITIQDTTPPAIDAGEDVITTLQTLAGSSVAIPSPIVTDGCDFNPTVTNNAPPLFPVGATTVTFTATDASNNSASDSIVVQVEYNFSNFLQPINADDSSIFKAGRTIPVKFQLTADDGSFVIDAVANIAVFMITDAILGTVEELDPEASGNSNEGTLFRYADDKYIYNLSTKGYSAGTYRIDAILNDGSTHSVNISLK